MGGTGYDVESAALRRYANAADQAADRVEKIRHRVGRLKLSSGVFGQLAESDSLKSDYDTQSEEAVNDLHDVKESLGAIADGVRLAAEAYDNNEDDQVYALGGGSA
ncbi:DUF2563 family protein [Streptomyces sp. NPDC048637]|uniref:DUF2563 family protein n=1 Tax=Streptomyces sp. NPDC048637 TaxID=3155636 RepID=UPI0034449883